MAARHRRRDEAAEDDGGAAARALLVAADGAVIEQVARAAGVAGVEVDVHPDLVAARPAWRDAGLVLVHDAVLRDDPSAQPPAGRDDVVLVADDVDDAGVWRRAVRIRAEHVVVLPDAEPWLVERMAATRSGGAPPGRLWALVGGRGGAGTSVLAAGLAATAAARGLRTALLDLDPLGSGADLALGSDGVPGLRWHDLVSVGGRVDGDALVDALPSVAGVAVLSWSTTSDLEPPTSAVRAVVEATLRTCDLVVVDLPRVLDERAVGTAARADLLHVVVPAEVRAVVAAGRVARRYRGLACGTGAVVRTPSPGGLRPSDVASALDLPLLGSVDDDPALTAELDRGESPVRRSRGAFAVACGALLDRALGDDAAGASAERGRR